MNLSVDGKTSAVHLFGGGDVSDVLADQDITVGPHDVIAPDLSTPISDGQKVVVRFGRQLTVTVDGQTKKYFGRPSTTVKPSGARCQGTGITFELRQALRHRVRGR